MNRDLLLYAECAFCHEMYQVPTVEAQNYIMLHQMPCRSCFNAYE